MAHSINGYRVAILAALIGAASGFAACSSDSTNNAPSNLGDDSGAGGKKATGGAAGSGAKPSTGGGGAGNTGGTANDKDSGSGGANTGGGSTGGAPPVTDSGACTEDTKTACLECPNIPTNDKEFLNHCGPGTSGCIKFTTTSTVPAKADLPTIP